jgi:hypothetical protein
MTYRTCVGCFFEKIECPAREAVRAQVRGLGVTTMRWRCSKRYSLLNPGDPVWAYTIVGDGSYAENEDEPYRAFFPATFIKEVGSRLIVYIEPGARARDDGGISFTPKNDSGFCKIPRSRITLRDGERVSVCRVCDWPESKGHAPGHSCSQEWQEEMKRLSVGRW